jgi:predicted acetyltransferase
MVELVEAPAARRAELAALLHDYMSEFDGSTGYPYLDIYWDGPGRLPFLVERDGEVVGFCLVRVLDDGGWNIAEFSTVPERRNQGLGRGAVEALAARAGRAGAPFLQAKVHPDNLQALGFWLACGFEQIPSATVVTTRRRL